jgi:hypothetical protein
MTPSPILILRQKLKDPSQPEKTATIRRLCGLPTPTFFAVVSALLIAFFVATEMARLRGRCFDPLLLLGASKGYRILPSAQLWIVLATINLGYAVAATS